MILFLLLGQEEEEEEGEAMTEVGAEEIFTCPSSSPAVALEPNTMFWSTGRGGRYFLSSCISSLDSSLFINSDFSEIIELYLRVWTFYLNEAQFVMISPWRHLLIQSLFFPSFCEIFCVFPPR